ncbi:MAG: GxxExxY protein [Microscillaceae bacterium]|nr:GxxExxY protein [Microscillaceae bacterium]
MKVHNTLGNGFQEVIYQRCLAIELQKAGLEFGREIEQTIYYEGVEVGTRRADFVVEGQVIVELKALINLEDVHLLYFHHPKRRNKPEQTQRLVGRIGEI